MDVEVIWLFYNTPEACRHIFIITHPELCEHLAVLARVRVKKLLSKLLLFIKNEGGNTFKQKTKPHHFRQS